MDPDSYLAMSGIQHFCFCRRQWALIHLEQLWVKTCAPPKGTFCMSAATTKPFTKSAAAY